MLVAFLRILASLVSRLAISFFRKSNLCEEGSSDSSCLIIALELLMVLSSLVLSILKPRHARSRDFEVGSI